MTITGRDSDKSKVKQIWIRKRETILSFLNERCGSQLRPGTSFSVGTALADLVKNIPLPSGLQLVLFIVRWLIVPREMQLKGLSILINGLFWEFWEKKIRELVNKYSENYCIITNFLG